MDYGGGCVVDDVRSLSIYYERVRHRSDFCVIVRPRDDELPRAFFRILKHSRDVWGIVEECDRYCSAYHIDPDLSWCLNYGRQFGINVIGCARRAAAVSRTWTSQADWIVAHQTQEPIDLKYLSEYGFDDELKTLDRFRWRRVGASRIF